MSNEELEKRIKALELKLKLQVDLNVATEKIVCSLIESTKSNNDIIGLLSRSVEVLLERENARA